jgi:hypothetical protein
MSRNSLAQRRHNLFRRWWARLTIGTCCCIWMLTASASAVEPALPATQPSEWPKPLGPADTAVLANQAAGGLVTVSPSTGAIELHWPAVPKASGYFVFRSDEPKIVLGWGQAMLGQPISNSFEDDQVQAGKKYYYAIVSLPDAPKTVPSLVAIGSCSVLKEDEALVGIYKEPPPTIPTTKLNYWDFVPREVFDELQSDRDEKAKALTDAQAEIEKLRAELAASKATHK